MAADAHTASSSPPDEAPLISDVLLQGPAKALSSSLCFGQKKTPRRNAGLRSWLFGHHHTRLDATIDSVPCMGINKAPHPGSLVAIDIGNRRQGMQVIGEWPRKAE